MVNKKLPKAKTKLTRKKCKNLLAKHAEKNKLPLSKAFKKRKTLKELELATKPHNWRFRARYSAHYKYEKVWEFVCEPFGRELVGYIYTTEDETEITNIIIQTE